MRRPLCIALLLMSAAGGGARLWGKRTEPPSLLKYKPGDSWTLEDTLRAQIPDPQTGAALTPTTRGLFRYRVDKVLPDGSVVVFAKVVSLKAGSSLRKLNAISVEYPEKPEQGMIMSPEGGVYGLYGDAARKKAVTEAEGVEAWLSSRPQALWYWYKIPETSMRVGGKVIRKKDDEVWTIRRQDDEVVSGITCAVYEARLEQEALQVMETTWFAHDLGYPVRREISEKRAKNVSSTLTQVRL